MEVKLVQQKTIYKNLKKMVELHKNLQVYLLQNYLPKKLQLKIKRYMLENLIAASLKINLCNFIVIDIFFTLNDNLYFHNHQKIHLASHLYLSLHNLKVLVRESQPCDH